MHSWTATPFYFSSFPRPLGAQLGFKRILWACLLPVFVALAIPNSGHGSPVNGIDLLGLAKMDADMIARELEPGSAVGTLMGTFGDPLPKLERLLQTRKVVAFRVHLINGVCWRNRNCERGEPKPNDLRALEARAREVNSLAQRYPQARCFISPVLEHDEKDGRRVQEWLRVLRGAAPACTSVISAFTGHKPGGTLLESHGSKPTGDIISTDGVSIFDINATKFGTGREQIRFAWYPELNLRYSGEKTFTPPSKRTCKTTAELVRQAQAVLKPAEPKPTNKPRQCKTVRELKDRELWKPNAESYCDSDRRGNRPLLISRIRNDTMDVLDGHSNRIGCVKYYGSYAGDKNYHRHYAGSCSGDSGLSLAKKAGGEYVYIQTGRQCLLVSAYRRAGYFRESER